MEPVPQKIIDSYRQADMTRRLYIYLRYPELRSEFLETEEKGQTLKPGKKRCRLKKKRE